MEIRNEVRDTNVENELNGMKEEREIPSREALEKYDRILGDDKLESPDFSKENISELTDGEALKKYERILGDDKIDKYFADKKQNMKKLPEEDSPKLKELNDEQKDRLRLRLGWSENQFKKCMIDENGAIHYRTDRCDMKGKRDANGVLYERKIIDINGVKIEGVFPVFESKFDTYLSVDNYKSHTYAKECNSNLKEAIQENPKLREQFTPEQLKDIEESRTPAGYVWHHNEEPGKMQLVKRVDHDRTIGGSAHTGGNILWGPDSMDHGEKGETF